MRPLRSSAFADAAPVDGRGQRKPADVLARASRDYLLRLAAERHCRGLSDRQAAEVIRAKLARYREGAFRRHRSEDQMPEKLRGTLNGMFWELLMVRDAVPCNRTVRAALALDPFSLAQ